jgi:uncharacterized cofD-like protein
MSKKGQDKKIVCLGGGSAMPKAVLGGLKRYPVKITAVSAMLDSGGSSGRLRKNYQIVSPGDIRRAFLALSDAPEKIKSLFNFRFQTGELKGHNFANLFITALKLSTGSYQKAFDELGRILKVSHQVFPATLSNSHLFAVLENGKTVGGETNIDVPKHKGSFKIKKLFLKPKARAYPRAVEAIKKADAVILGPGDLYSSLAQILLVEGISEAVRKSRAKKIYICNLMTKKGETDNFGVSDFSQEIEKYLGAKIDRVVYNKKKPSGKRLRNYRKVHPEMLELVSFNKGVEKDKKFLGVDVLTVRGEIVHDSQKLSRIIFSLI